jgi:hypothetical protein
VSSPLATAAVGNDSYRDRVPHPSVVLAEPEWQARRAAHRDRTCRWTEPHRARKARGEQHPVLDFLFSYYSYRPSRLERWHPGPGMALAGESAREYLAWPDYADTSGGVALDPAAFTASRRRTAEFVLALVRATASRQPVLACFGLHEWAMVYRQRPEQIRHADWSLRLGPAGTDAVLESLPVRCGHYDAFRFFTTEAKPRNAVQPTRESQVDLEQPGCLHATMDLFKWSYKLAPFTPSDLVADCFELAVEVRELDMRASPYDLSVLGYSPVRIETAQGRAEYATAQARFAKRATPLRARLIDLCRTLLSWP